MKASDICVGDWLNIYTLPNDNPKQDDLFPAKVNAVSIFDPFNEPDDAFVELVIERTKDIASRPLDTCLPIKLTEEILVKNGFEKTKGGEYKRTRYVMFSDKSWVALYTREAGGYSAFLNKIVVIHYVHQLQHLLRLCGIEKEIEL